MVVWPYSQPYGLTSLSLFVLLYFCFLLAAPEVMSQIFLFAKHEERAAAVARLVDAARRILFHSSEQKSKGADDWMAGWLDGRGIPKHTPIGKVELSKPVPHIQLLRRTKCAPVDNANC